MIIFLNEVEILKIVEGKFRLLKKQMLSLSYLLNANITLQLLESITHNYIIKTLRGKSDYVISETNVSLVKGQTLFLSDNKYEEKNLK